MRNLLMAVSNIGKTYSFHDEVGYETKHYHCTRIQYGFNESNPFAVRPWVDLTFYYPLT